MSQQPAQPLAAESQDAASAIDVARRPRNLKGWRTVRELRDELRFSTDDACRSWLRRHGIVGVRRGRKILVDGLDVDRVLRTR